MSSEHWIVGDPGPGPRRILALITPTPVLVPRAVTQVCSGVSLARRFLHSPALGIRYQVELLKGIPQYKANFAPTSPKLLVSAG